MKERQIIFSAPMVRARLDGTKTQTRRVMARQKKYDFTDYTLFGQRGHADDEAQRRGGWAEPWVAVEHAPDWPDGKEDQCQCPYATQRGDRLWVRETWAHDAESLEQCRASFEDAMGDGRYGPYYLATESAPDTLHWKPSIHMPRWASRITLEITGVRVERLQNISEADAIAEGLTSNGGLYASPGQMWQIDPRKAYSNLWESINGPGSWDQNLWVWVIEFKRVTP